MKRIASFIMVMALLFSMLPVVYAAESAKSVELLNLDNYSAEYTGVSCKYTPETDGTIYVTLGNCSPSCRYMTPGFKFWYDSASFEVTAGTNWSATFCPYNTSTKKTCSGTLSLTVIFIPNGSGGEVTKNEYEVSSTALSLGDNNVTMLETAETTIFQFKPSATGTYVFTAPKGVILGYWGASQALLKDPGSTTNTYTWTCTGVGQSVYIGVSGVEGTTTVNVTQKDEKVHSSTALTVGSNTLTLIDTAVTTLFKFTPDETGAYTFTAPEGVIVGNWGSNSNALTNPGSTTNTCEWECTDVDQCVYIGVSGADGEFVLTVGKAVVPEPTEPETTEPETTEPETTEPEASEPEATDPSEPAGPSTPLSWTNEAITTAGYTFTYTAASAGTLSVTLGDCSPACRYQVTAPDGKQYLFKNTSSSYESEAGTWKVSIFAFDFSKWEAVAGTLSLDVTFTPEGYVAPDPSEPESTEPTVTEPSEPESTEPEATEPSEPAGPSTLLSLTNEAITSSGYLFEYTATADGTLTVELGDSSPACRYFYGSSLSYTYDTSKSYEITAGTKCKIRFYVYSSNNTSGNLSVTVTFTPKDSGGEVEKSEYEVSDTKLALGDNNVTMLETAVTTIFVFEPTKTGTYDFTAPEGAILGYWGASSAWLTDPGSTTNTYTWTCDSVGQSVYIGISGVEGTALVNVYEHEKLVDKWNLVLDDDFLVNFHLNIRDEAADTAQVQISVGGSSTIYNASEMNKSEDGKHIAPIHVAPAQMMDSITVQIIDSEDASEPSTYSIRQYADAILGDNKYSQYHSIVKEMLNYGATAQTYFNYNTESLANDGISGVGASEIPETPDDEMVKDGSANGITYYGATLLFQDKIAVRFYFEAESIDGLTFTVDGDTCEPKLVNGYYMVEVNGIYPQNLNKQITVSVSDGSSTLSISYGPMNYIVRMNAKGTDNMKALLKALYNYHLAAKLLRAETV